MRGPYGAYGSMSLKSQNAKVCTIYNEVSIFSIFIYAVNRELDTYLNIIFFFSEF